MLTIPLSLPYRSAKGAGAQEYFVLCGSDCMQV